MTDPDPEPVFTLDRYTVLANPQSTLNLPEVEGVGELRRVGCFQVVDEGRKVVAFRNDDAPHLEPGFKIFNDGDLTRRILSVDPDGPRDWVVRAGDSEGEQLGRWRLRGRLLRAPAWDLLNASGSTVAHLDDGDLSHGLGRRWRRARHKESLRLMPTDGSAPWFFLRDRAAQAYVLRAVRQGESSLDRRLVLAGALCFGSIAGLTDFLRPAATNPLV